MAKTLSSAIGIDVGTNTIKIAELRAGRDRHALSAVAIVPTPMDGIDHNGIYDPAPIVAAIKQAISEGGISVKQAIMGISGQSSVVVRMLEVPKMSPVEMKEHMAWEIQRNIPFAESTIVSDYARVPNPDEAPDAQQMDVVLAVAPQSAVDTVVQVMQGAGLTPIGIDVPAMAISRLLCLQETNEPAPCMVVNIGATMTSIDVYRFGFLNFPRVLPLGGVNFTQAIAETLGITEEEAEDYKRSKAEVILDRYGFAAPVDTYAPEPPVAQPTESFQPYNPYVDTADQGPTFEVEPDMEPGEAPSVSEGEDAQASMPAAHELYIPPPTPVLSTAPVAEAHSDETVRVFDAVAPLLEELTSEVRRSLEYFTGRGAGYEVGQILLVGGGAKLKGLDRFMQQALNVPTSVYAADEALHVSVRRQPFEYVQEHAAELAVAVGLALHAFEE